MCLTTPEKICTSTMFLARLLRVYWRFPIARSTRSVLVKVIALDPAVRSSNPCTLKQGSYFTLLQSTQLQPSKPSGLGGALRQTD